MSDRNKNHHRSPHNEDAFVCRHCNRQVSPDPHGTRHRNHCPWCLWSLHLDDSPGDRASPCHGQMEPLAIWVKRDGEWSIIHRCATCGILKPNRIASDDIPWSLMALAAKAISQPPFPLEP